MKSPDLAPSRYRRRRRWPMLVVLALLLAGGVVVWTQILKPAPPQATGCNEPGPAPSTTTSASGTGGSLATTSASGTTGGTTAATSSPATATGSAATTGAAASSGASASGASASGAASSVAASSGAKIPTTLGTFTDPNVLAAMRPADPAEVPLRVLNASDVIGQAKTVTDELRDAGFSSIGQQANDPLYPAWDLRCYGEIRYGWAGVSEARTVLVVAPCAQLVRDDRSDNSVDLSLGKLYQVEPISKQVLAELTQIKNASAPPPVIEGQTVSVRPVPPIPPLPSRSGCPA